MTREDRINGLIALDEKINNELFALQNSINEVLKFEPNEELHAQYLSRTSYIQTLFDRVSDTIREISLTETDTKFYEAVKAKDRISNNYVRFNRMQNQIEQFFNKDRQSETDFLMHTIQPEFENSDDTVVDENEMVSEVEEQQDDSFLEEQLIAEEEDVKKKKTAKKKADALKQKAISDAEQRRFAENEQRSRESRQQAENERRRAETDAMYRKQENQRQPVSQHPQVESDTLHREDGNVEKQPKIDYNQPQSSYMSHDYQYTHSADYPENRPQKQVSAADLRDEQYRQEEKREAEREQARARRQETHDKFVAYQEDHRPKDVPPSEPISEGNTSTYTVPDRYSSGPRPEKPVSAADLRDQQYREEEKRAAEREKIQARRQETHDKFSAYQEEHRPTTVYPTKDVPISNNPTHTSEDTYSTNQRPKKPVTSDDFGDTQYREKERRVPNREPAYEQKNDQRTKNSGYHDVHHSLNKEPSVQTPNYVSPQHKNHDNKSSFGSPKVNHDILKENPSKQPFFGYTPSGIAQLNPSKHNSLKQPGNGSFQGIHLQQNDKSSSPLKPSSSGHKSHSGSTSTQHGSSFKKVRPQAQYTHYGYTPAGIVAGTAVNGVLKPKHTTYKVSTMPGASSPTRTMKLHTGQLPVNNKSFLKPGQSLKQQNTTSSRSVDNKKPIPTQSTRANSQTKTENIVNRKKSTIDNLRNSQSSHRRHETINGSTGQTKRGNANRIKKTTVKEPGSGLNKKNTHLRSQAIARTYVKSIGGKTVRYAGNVFSMGARKLYGLLQDGEDNTIRGFETSRYYGMAATGVLKAYSNRKVSQRLVKKAFGNKVKLKDIDNKLDGLKQAHNKAIQKKFGDLSRLSGKELSKEIKLLKAQGANLKEQIKVLQSKGSALSVAERKELMQLRKSHKALSERLRKLIGLERAQQSFNKGFNKKVKLTKKARKLSAKNAFAIKNGLFALQRAVFSPLHKSDEIGVQGIAKALNLSTNRYVHIFVKNSFRATWKLTKVVVKTPIKVAKGIKKVSTAAKTAKDARTLVKTGHTTGKMSTRLLPKKVKTLPGTAVKKVLKKPNAAGAKKVFQGAINGTKKSIESLRLLFKGGTFKVIAIVVAFIILIGLISTVISSVSGSAGSLVLSTDTTEDGKIDLSSYYDIIIDEWNEYIRDLNKQGESEGAEKLVVNMEAIPGNTRELLSMMAVRMSQNLDLEKNDDIEPYLRYLVRKLNPFTKTESKYYCAGCKRRPVEGGTKTYCPGHKMITFNVTSLRFGPAEELNDPIFSADEMSNEEQEVTDGSLIGTFEITYYGPTGNLTATETVPKAGRTIAVDKNIIPLGTHVIIDGHEYVAEDTGGVIDGYIIDIFVDSVEEAKEKGRRHDVKVYHVNYEGEDIQTTGKWDGWTEGNKEWAKNIYYQDWGDIYSGVPMVTGVGNNTTDLSGVNFVDGERKGNQKIVNIAKDQEGYSEGYKFYKWYGFDYHVHWCATFVSWCANEAGVLGSAVPKFAHCALQGVPWFQNKGQWARPGDVTPVAGDIIFFDWGRDGTPDHVGIVIGSDGSKVYTIEGNTGDYPGVARIKSYNLSYAGIYGYGIPNY